MDLISVILLFIGLVLGFVIGFLVKKQVKQAVVLLTNFNKKLLL